MLVIMSAWKHNRKVKSLQKSIDTLNWKIEHFARYVNVYLEFAATSAEHAGMYQLKAKGLHSHEQEYKQLLEKVGTKILEIKESYEQLATICVASQPRWLEELDLLESLKQSEIEAWQDRAHTTALKKIQDEKVAGGIIPKVKCCIRSLALGVKTA